MNLQLGGVTVEVQVGDKIIIQHRLSGSIFPCHVDHIYEGRVYAGTLAFDAKGKCTTPANKDFRIAKVTR